MGRKNKGAGPQRAVRTEEGRTALGWLAENRLLVFGISGLVLAVAISQFVFLATGWSAFGGGVRNLDLEGEGAIRDALTSGKPWMLFCDQDAQRMSMTRYRKAKEVFMETAAGLSSSVNAGTLDCGRRVSRKSVFQFVGLSQSGVHPATVLIAANGRKPAAVPAPFLTSRAKLAKQVQKRTKLELLELKPGRSKLNKCLQARSCVILAHSGQKGRRPVRAVVEDMMAAYRVAQFATLDTSKVWLAGLPNETVAALPRAPFQPSRVEHMAKGDKPAVLKGWGTGNNAKDRQGQVVMVLRRDPRKPGPSSDAKAHKLGRGVLVSWVSADDASGGGGGRLLVSRGDVNAAMREADEAAARASGAGGFSGGRDAAAVLTAVSSPQIDWDRVAGAVAGQLRVVRAPAVPKIVQEEADPRLKRQRARARAREERKHKAGTYEGTEAEEAADAAEDRPAERKQRVREVMEEEARQWMPEAVPEGQQEEQGDEYYDEYYEEYEEEDAGFAIAAE